MNFYCFTLRKSKIVFYQINQEYSLYKTVRQIPKLIITAYEKMLLLDINTISKFLLFRMKYNIDGVLFDY